MIYGKITLEDWRTVCVEGEEPESSFESYNFRLFFFGTLYNRDQLQSSPADSNAKLVADAYLADSNYGFSRLDGSFTIVYYSKEECGIVRDHHGTHYSIYCTPEGDFASSWTYLEKQSGKPFSYDPGAFGWRRAVSHVYGKRIYNIYNIRIAGGSALALLEYVERKISGI